MTFNDYRLHCTRSLQFLLVFLSLLGYVFLASATARADGYPYKNLLSKYTFENTGQDRDYTQSSRPAYPWRTEPLGNYNIGSSGCGLTSATIQLKRSGITKLKNGDELNPGNFAHAAQSQASTYLNQWVIKFNVMSGLFPDGDVEWVKLDYKLFGQTGQPGVQMIPQGSDSKDIATGVQQGIDKGYYPIMLLNQPGHFVAVKDVGSDKKSLDIYDPERTADKIVTNGRTDTVGNKDRTYNMQQIIGVVFLKMKTSIKDAKGGDNSDSSDGSSSTSSGNTTASPSNAKVDNTFTVNGYGANHTKDWDEANLDNSLPKGTGTSDNDAGIDLDSYQKQALNDWEDDNTNSVSAVTITYIRTGVSLAGFLAILLGIMLVFSFAFDRLGVLDFSLVSFVTSGHLKTVYDAQDENFLSQKKLDVRGVSTKSIIVIVLMCTMLATLCFTGVIYNIAYHLYLWSYQIIQFGNTLH